MSAEPPISEREREILRLVAEGATNQQIAQQLDISVNTVKVHLRNIFGKIGVASRTEATVYAIRQGLVLVDGRAVEPAPLAAEPVVALEEPGSPPFETPFEPAAPPKLTEGGTPSSTRRVSPLLLGGALVAVLALMGILALVFARPSQPLPVTPPAATPAPAQSEATRWRTRTPLARERADFGVAALDGRLYVVGGRNGVAASAGLDRYDPANDVWVELTDKPTAAGHVKAVALGRSIYVPGGEGNDGRALDVFEAYDVRNQQWELLPPLPAPRSRYALASYEGRLYLFGGWDGASYRSEVFVYDPAARSWSEEPQPLPTARRAAAAAVVEGRIYVVGGEDESGELRSNERYDPNSTSGQQWENMTPLPQAVDAPGAVGVLDVVLVFDAASGAAAQYTPRTDNWVTLELPGGTPLSARVAFLGTSVFVFGPGDQGTPVALSEYQAIYTTFLPGTTGSER
jgi:DNA-binding CsgD family transcriptional regulator